VTPLRLRRDLIYNLESRILLCYTGKVRPSVGLIDAQVRYFQEGREETVAAMHRLKEMTYEMTEALLKGKLDRFGELLDEHWQNKKKLSNKISWSRIDEVYDEVRRRFGVLGGKVIGAGGGGFLMLYSSKQHARLESFMRDAGMPRMHYNVEPEGTKVVAQMGHGFLSASQSLAVAAQESA